MKEIYFAACVTVILMGAGCVPYSIVKPPLPVDATGERAREYVDEIRLNKVIDGVAEQAVEMKDPKRCLELPLKGVVWAWQDDGYEYDATPMRWVCLNRFYLNPTAGVCDLFKDLAEEDAYFDGNKKDFIHQCYVYAAQVENNAALCDRIMNDPDAQTHCAALVTKDANRCLAITRLRDDQKKKESVASVQSALARIRDTSYSAATCIQAVAFQYRDYQVCALINGTSFGEDWTRSRNHCLEIAGYRLRRQGKPNNFCDAYVEDHSNIGALSWGAQMNCQKHGATIDPNDFWKIERQNVLHILPGIKD